MKVQGYDVTAEQYRACIARMKQFAYFSAYQIESAVEKAGAPGWAAMRIADRIIQRERKAGNIVRVRQMWRHNEAPAPM